jgi:hypothetical protein
MRNVSAGSDLVGFPHKLQLNTISPDNVLGDRIEWQSEQNLIGIL